jgi:antirestriction protein ArdC
VKTSVLYETVTNNIIADLARGVAPSLKPWKTGKSVALLPTKIATGRHPNLKQ